MMSVHDHDGGRLVCVCLMYYVFKVGVSRGVWARLWYVGITACGPYRAIGICGPGESLHTVHAICAPEDCVYSY